MNISQEKLAQIEAGANPGDVLSEAELKEYNAAIEGDAPKVEGEEAAPGTEAGGTEPPPVEDPAPAPAGITADNYRQALKDAATADAKAETLEAKVTELEGKLQAREQTFESLMAIGVDALQKRQVALGKPATEPSTAEALVNSYNDVSAEMAKRFRVGQQSAAQATEEEEAPSGVPLALQVRRK